MKKNLLMTCWLGIVSTGCAYTPITIPDIKPCSQATVKQITDPGPVPKNLNLEIKEGKAVVMDANGEKFIRAYLAVRKAIKEQ